MEQLGRLRGLVERYAKAADSGLAWVERVAVVLALFGMTLLAFDEYLQREFRPLLGTDMFGLWSTPGQMNMALLLMVVVGFVGASLATREGKHLTVDAIDRALSPTAGRWLKRFTALASALLCFVLVGGSLDAVYEYQDLNFEGVKVWWWLVPFVNLGMWLIPGEKYGPGTPHADRMAWEDAQFAAGVDFDQLPNAFPYVAGGDGFPMPLAILILVVSFTIMGLRFLARVLYPLETPALPVAAGAAASAAPEAPPRKGRDLILAFLLPATLLAFAFSIWAKSGVGILVTSILLVVLGAPLFVGIGVGTVACWLLIRNGSTQSVVNDMFGVAKQQSLLAIPFFVLAGNIMSQGTIATRLIDVARALLSRVPGGLGVGGVVACAIFAAISGSSPVTVIAIGSIVYPMLVKDGYGENFSMGLLTTSGGLGIIIPPSIPMIVYAIVCGDIPAVVEAGGVDVAKLFMAGIAPGIFIAVALSVYTLVYAARTPSVGKREPGVPLPPYWPTLGTALRKGILSLSLPIVILGGIYGVFDLGFLGIDLSLSFTVTEAAAVAVIYALVVEMFIHREMKWKQLPAVFTESAVMMGSLILIIMLAISLNLFFSFEELPEKATAFMVANVDSTLTFLIVVNIFLFLLGMVMDILSAILIVAPLLAPIAMQYGIHPIHFGIMFIVNLEIGYLTPPMGINLFVASTVFEKPIVQVIRSIVPFLLLMIGCLVVIIAFPQLSLFLVE